MRRLLLFALPALLSANALQEGAPSLAAWRWQRAIVPNAKSPAAEQCVVLDADLFARAAPGLRDVRLLQDGRELAYATDISLDDRTARRSSSDADRALYEVSLVVPAYPGHWAGPVSNSDEFSRPEHPPGYFYGHGVLPAHVPVERVRLDSPKAGTEYLSMRAAEADRLPDAETLEAVLTPEHPAAAFTVGANLQGEADIMAGVQGDAAVVTAFVLEMRRREICYQPLTLSPVTLLFGNPGAPSVHYDFAKDFQPKTTPLMASMGPTQPNPAFHATTEKHALQPTRAKLVMAIAGCLLILVLTLRPLLRKRP